ncbi:MAG: hypothetical protein IPL71_21940 [Anaerolineales bacterium]|uniref:hypothetical protein n=1 Tax=Candidatus Villigracilis proximus TaxID=3140683 RepID=UPI0031364217|nr:hypothetical protein [Anaerolineales bacterium]
MDKTSKIVFSTLDIITKSKSYENMEVQIKELVMPPEILKGGGGEYNKWVREISRALVDDGERIRLEDSLYGVDHWVQVFDDYKFPVVTLSDSTSAEAGVYHLRNAKSHWC